MKSIYFGLIFAAVFAVHAQARELSALDRYFERHTKFELADAIATEVRNSTRCARDSQCHYRETQATYRTAQIHLLRLLAAKTDAEHDIELRSFNMWYDRAIVLMREEYGPGVIGARRERAASR